MFSINICKEVNDFLKEIRAELKNKGYKESKSRTNRYIGSLHLNSITEYHIKGKTIFEIERDLENNIIITYLHYGNDLKEIRLADIKDLC